MLLLTLPAFKDRLRDIEQPTLSILSCQFQIVSEGENELQLYSLLALADIVELVIQAALVVHLEASEVVLIDVVVDLDYFDDILLLEDTFVG